MKCKSQVWSRSVGWRGGTRPCRFNAVTEAGYCKTHDPEIRSQKDAATRARWKAEWDADAKRHRLHVAAPALLAALKGLTARYVGLVESGDAGFWDAEAEPEVIQARGAIKAAEEGS